MRKNTAVLTYRNEMHVARRILFVLASICILFMETYSKCTSTFCYYDANSGTEDIDLLRGGEVSRRALQSSSSDKNMIELNLTAFTIGVMSIDLRHLYDYSSAFLLNSQWSVTLQFVPNSNTSNVFFMTFNQLFPEPDGFTVSDTKSDMISFMALSDGTLTILLQPLDNQFADQYLNFINVFDYKLMKPNRANYGQTNLFMAIVFSSSTNGNIVLPNDIGFINISNTTVQAPIIVSSADYDASVLTSSQTTNSRLLSHDSAQIRRRGLQWKYQLLTRDRNLQSSTSPGNVNTIPKASDVENLVFSGANQLNFLAVPYLPFFTHCGFYGSYIYIPAIFEAHPNCKLINPADTVPISDFKFGMDAIADSCTDLTLLCSYSENITNLDSGSTYWFQAPFGTSLFQFYQDPVSLNLYNNYLNGQSTVNSEDFVNVVVQSVLQSNKIPTTVQFNLSYYQRDQYTKRLIISSIEYLGFIDPASLGNQTVYNYTLKLNFIPLGHTALTIAFALPWTVYMVMYLIVGMLAIGMASIFTIYHWLVSRYRKKGFYFWQLIKLYQPPHLMGFFLSMAPFVLYIVIIALLFTEHLMTYSLTDWWCNGDPNCKLKTIWDGLTIYSSGMNDTIRGAQQKVRLGFLFLHTGIWLHWRFAHLSTIRMENKESKKESLSHDNNIWTVTSWNRMNYFVMSVVLIVFELYFANLSFSSIFGNNVWFFLGGLIVLGSIVEETAEELLQNMLLLTPISASFNVYENLFTFGATDFNQFIRSNLISLGGSYIQRIAIELAKKRIANIIKEKYGELMEWLKKLLGEEEKDEEIGEGPSDDEEEEGQKKEYKDQLSKKSTKKKDEEEHGLGKSKVHKKDGDPDDSMENGAEREKSVIESECSDILLTERSGDNEAIDELNKKINLGNEKREGDKHREINEIAKRKEVSSRSKVEEIRVKVQEEISRKSRRKDEFEEGYKHMMLQVEDNKKKKNNKDEKEKLKHKDHLNEKVTDVDADENLEYWHFYTAQTTSLFYLPISCLIIWQFYNEAGLAAKWSIQQKNFLFYFLYSVMFIPFQTVIDVFCYNIATWAFNYDFINCLRYWKIEDEKKGKIHWWRGLTPEKLEMEESKIRPLEQYNFNSQFYFLSYIGMHGHFLVIVGVQMMLQATLGAAAPSNTPYFDPMFFPLLAINQLIILFVEWLCVWIRKKFRIWETAEQKPHAKTERTVSLAKVGTINKSESRIRIPKNLEDSQLKLSSKGRVDRDQQEVSSISKKFSLRRLVSRMEPDFVPNSNILGANTKSRSHFPNPITTETEEFHHVSKPNV